MHQPSAHCVHVYGAYDVWPSKGDTRITDFAGWNSPVCTYEQAISQRRQPVQRVGWILRTRAGSAVRVAISPFLSWGALRSVAVGLETVDELVERDRRHRHAVHAAARAELDRDARDGRVARRVDDGDEVVGAEDGVLRDHAGAHALDVGLNLPDPARPLAQHLAPGLGERAEHDVQTHATSASLAAKIPGQRPRV